MDKTKLLSVSQVLLMLKEKQGDRSTPKFAKELGVTGQCLRNIYHSESLPGPKVLDAIGLERVRQTVVRYRFKQDSAKRKEAR
jgi:hypothetical protein